ncbi:hypothetical protein BJP39_06845 [Streptomyces sp. CC77]|nr:hypothetical protein BJP39_06845 [Streptomyces sp. CC77]
MGRPRREPHRGGAVLLKRVSQVLRILREVHVLGVEPPRFRLGRGLLQLCQFPAGSLHRDVVGGDGRGQGRQGGAHAAVRPGLVGKELARVQAERGGDGVESGVPWRAASLLDLPQHAERRVGGCGQLGLGQATRAPGHGDTASDLVHRVRGHARTVPAVSRIW